MINQSTMEAVEDQGLSADSRSNPVALAECKKERAAINELAMVNRIQKTGLRRHQAELSVEPQASNLIRKIEMRPQLLEAPATQTNHNQLRITSNRLQTRRRTRTPELIISNTHHKAKIKAILKSKISNK